MRRAFPLLLCVACAVGPKYERPELPLPQQYRFAEGKGASIANLGWWQVFQDPVLQRLVRDSLEHNYDVRLAAARVDELRGQYKVARAGQLPQVSVGASGGRERVSAGQSPTGAPVTTNFLGFNGQISYQADFWGQYRNLSAEARAALLAQEEAQHNVLLTVITDVAQAYFQLRELDRELEVTQRTVSSFQDSLRLTQIRFQGSVASELDVRQAETALYGAMAQVPQLELQIAQQENAISVLTGRNPGSIPRGVPISEQRLPGAVPAGLPSDLLARRPDVRQAEQQLVGAYAGVGVALSQFFPQFALTAQGGFTSTALSTLVNAPALAWQLVASATQAIFTGGRLRGNLEAAEARKDEAEIQFIAAFQRALADVDDALIAYRKTGEQVATERALVESSSAAVRLANQRYTAGVSTYLEVLDAERQLFNAEVSQARTQGALLNALVRVYTALGGGWEQPAQPVVQAQAR